MKYNLVKKRIHEILEKGKNYDKPSIIFDYFIIVLIILNVLAIFLESFQNIYKEFSSQLKIFEIISIIIFTIEYILRLWTAELKITKKNFFISRIIYILTPMALIDLFAILPFYLPLIISFDLRFLRILRLVRIFRLFKIQRYSKSLNIISKVLKDKKEDLIVTIFVTFLLILIASTMMYYLEHDVQPENFPNIFYSFWWAVATLTTVGYGDIYPLTGWGKFLSGIIALLGIGLVALPTGIISSGFIEQLGKQKESKKYNEFNCPHCKKKIKINEE